MLGKTCFNGVFGFWGLTGYLVDALGAPLGLHLLKAHAFLVSHFLANFARVVLRFAELIGLVLWASTFRILVLELYVCCDFAEAV